MPILQLLTIFPTAIPTVLLAVLMIYWLMSIIGVVDIGESLDIHTETGHLDGIEAAHGGHEVPDMHTLAGYLVALGLGGVPLLCARELDVPGALPRVIRLLVHCYAEPDAPVRHVYLREAVALRRDLEGAQ